MNSQRTASAMILTVGFVALIVSLGSLFLVKASAKYDESISQKLAAYAEQATETAFAHARQKILEDYVNNEYTSFQSQYKLAFSALDTNGNPMHSLSAFEDPAQIADDDPRINVPNVDRVSKHQIELYQNDEQGVQQLDAAYGLNMTNNFSSRYHDLFFVDINGDVVDETIADYVVRYTVEIGDENAKMAINNDYPGYPITFDFADPDKDEYLQFQVYLHRYGRAIRSMVGGLNALSARQFVHINNAYGTYWLNSRIYETIDATGTTGTSTDSLGISRDQRVFYDQLFRTGGLVQQGNTGRSSSTYNNVRTHLSPTIPGKIFSYGQILSHAKNHSEQSMYSITRMFSPYNTGLRDKDWPTSDQGFDPYINNFKSPNCPWRLNIVTANLFAIQKLIFGMSSHLRCEDLNRNWSRTGRNATMDIFGNNYPEAFPLDLDSGKSVHLIGGDTNAAGDIVNGTKHLPYNPRITNLSSSDNGNREQVNWVVPVAYRNSYWWDVSAALYRAIQVGKGIWNYKVDPNDNSANEQLRAYDVNCKITTTPGDLSANPKQMIAQLEAEFLRIIGENVNVSYNSGSNEVEYVLNDGLLATPITRDNNVYVGFGATADAMEEKRILHLSSADDYTETVPVLNRRRCRLRTGENTRSMEYLLNDVRMSVFGSPALNFNKDDASGNGAVGTTADDHDAESTYNGWWDYDQSTGTRTRTWSWWYEGVAQVHSDNLRWLEFPTWYRFWHDGTNAHMSRWNGHAWESRDSDIAYFFTINKVFLDDDFISGAATHPIKPWSATGRIFAGHSQIFNIVARGELYDILSGERVTQFTAEQFLHVDPDRNENLSDTVVLYQRTYGRNKSHSSTED